MTAWVSRLPLKSPMWCLAQGRDSGCHVISDVSAGGPPVCAGQRRCGLPSFPLTRHRECSNLKWHKNKNTSPVQKPSIIEADTGSFFIQAAILRQTSSNFLFSAWMWSSLEGGRQTYFMRLGVAQISRQEQLSKGFRSVSCTTLVQRSANHGGPGHQYMHISTVPLFIRDKVHICICKGDGRLTR